MDAASLLEENQTLQQRVRTLEADKSLLGFEIKSLRLKVDELLRRLYGQSSEKISPEQIQMLMEGLEKSGQSSAPPLSEPKDKTSSPRRSSSPREPRGLPKHLRTQE